MADGESVGGGGGGGGGTKRGGGEYGGAPRSKRAKTQTGVAPRPRQNTAVYVTGLPEDATVEEVAELFSRKCGVIAEEIDSGRPRIKMYTDADGRFKGDALIVFFKPQSVEMAIMLLDDADFRFGGGRRIHVQAADASYKKTTYTSETAEPPETAAATEGERRGQGGDASSATRHDGAAAAAAAAAASEAARTASGGGGSSGNGRGRGGAATSQDKQKIIKKTQKLDAKLADWSSDEELGGTAYGGGGRRSARWDKVVILKHMFTLAELDEDPAALLDIKEDIREECAKLGDVTNVVLFDGEADGVVSVKFKTPDAAMACVRLMGGRAFDGRIVEATLATGRERFNKSKKNDAELDSDSDSY